MPSPSPRAALALAAVLALHLVPAFAPISAGEERLLVYFEGANAANWRPIGGSPPPRKAPDGLRFALPFAGGGDRVYWDHSARLDLSRYTSFELDISCETPATVRHIGLYFKSGGGWYVCNKPIPAAGRVRMLFPKADFSTEEKPAGWHRVEAIRFSPWKGSGTDGELVAHALRAVVNRVVLVKATVSAPDSVERSYSARVADRIGRWLTDMGVSHAVITDDDVRAGRLAGASLAVLCYNPDPPPDEIAALREFVRHGKLIVFYSASAELANLMGMRLGEYTKTDTAGRWSAISFPDAAAQHLPETVVQESLNIRPVYPSADGAEVMAYWVDGKGRRSDDPAWVAGPNGAWMSHVLLEGDAPGKQQMLLAILGRYDPAVWHTGARSAVERAGTLDHTRSFDDTLRHIRSLDGARDNELIEGLLKRAATLYQQTQRLYAKGRYPEAATQAAKVRAALTEAYSRAQPPRASEFRGVWEHDGVGWYPGDWDATCRRLAGHGITAIFPNMLWGGLAHYPSRVLPRSSTYRRYGDQVAQCVKAAHASGLEVHAWMVCWNLQGAPEEFVKRARAEGRVQVDRDGKPLGWLNPAHPANHRLALDALREMVTAYPVDGVHLDYVRYPGSAVDYSAATRERFEEWLGRKAEGWPRSAESGGALADAYRKFRADQISLFVRAVREQLRPLRPGLKISAAVYKNYPECIASVGQDWGRWLREGYLDFVAPMSYTRDLATFRAWTRDQLALPGAAGKVLPGLGVTANESELRPVQVIDQILALRASGAPGFVLFDLSQTLRDETLPALSLGVTRPVR